MSDKRSSQIPIAESHDVALIPVLGALPMVFHPMAMSSYQCRQLSGGFHSQ